MQSPPTRAPRFFIDTVLPPGSRVTLPQDASHHALRVLRLREGDRITLFDGRGGEYAARLLRPERNGVDAEVGEFQDIERESPLRITLAQGVSAGDRMDLTIQKSVELGVTAIQPLSAERSVVRLKGDRSESRREHWQRVAMAACEQCGRNRVPAVAPVLSALEYHAPLESLRLLLAPGAGTSLRSLTFSASMPVVLASGPEAGFSPREEAALIASGFVPVHLGPRILRTETAAPAALAALNALAGDA